MTTLAQLVERFTIDGVKFVLHQQLPRIDVDTPLVKAQMYLHGAHVAHWQPAGHLPVLWMSQRSYYQADKPLRGGVPICSPWFGPHSSDGSLPAHGWARLQSWELVSIDRGNNDAVRVKCATRIAPLQLEYVVEFGERLKLELSTALPADHGHTVQFEEALHTYFVASDVRQIEIRGLESASYIDKVGQPVTRPAQRVPIQFTRETDRVYFDTFHTCRALDRGLQREIVVSKNGSSSTVVWNPWIDKSQRMADFGDDEWTGMFCIETANVGTGAIVLAPGQQHKTSAVIEVVAQASSQ